MSSTGIGNGDQGAGVMQFAQNINSAGTPCPATPDAGGTSTAAPTVSAVTSLPTTGGGGTNTIPLMLVLSAFALASVAALGWKGHESSRWLS